jgi:prolyl-tRNA editing enzyme YbaK/EbsC (Cys-tRNA(Pro) deacylase)
MHERAQEFAERARREYSLEVDVNEFPEGTKTAEDAAEAIGCDVAQIASSIAMRADDELVVVVTSGANRVSTERVAALHGADSVEMADAGEIKATLGWSIGGVPPFCHEVEVPVYVDDTLTGFETVWAAAGTPEAVFPIDPARLRELSDGEVADVAE